MGGGRVSGDASRSLCQSPASDPVVTAKPVSCELWPGWKQGDCCHEKRLTGAGRSPPGQRWKRAPAPRLSITTIGISVNPVSRGHSPASDSTHHHPPASAQGRRGYSPASIITATPRPLLKVIPATPGPPLTVIAATHRCPQTRLLQSPLHGHRGYSTASIITATSRSPPSRLLPDLRSRSSWPFPCLRCSWSSRQLPGLSSRSSPLLPGIRPVFSARVRGGRGRMGVARRARDPDPRGGSYGAAHGLRVRVRAPRGPKGGGGGRDRVTAVAGTRSPRSARGARH